MSESIDAVRRIALRFDHIVQKVDQAKIALMRLKLLLAKEGHHLHQERGTSRAGGPFKV